MKAWVRVLIFFWMGLVFVVYAATVLLPRIGEKTGL